jgi:hypothetical protein
MVNCFQMLKKPSVGYWAKRMNNRMFDLTFNCG